MVIAGTVAAHGGLENYAASVTSIQPPVPGLSVTIVGGDDQVLLTNRTGLVVVVPGYEGEPYLRFADGRVFANRNSPAYYLNADRGREVPVPANADPAAQPDWIEVVRGDTFAWHDRRVQWNEVERPAAVQAEPGVRQVVREWSIVLDAGQPVTVRGVLEWVPAADGSIWLGIGAVLLAAGILAGRKVTGDIDDACARLGPAASGPALVAVVLAANGFIEGGDTLRDAATVLLAAVVASVGLMARSAPSAPIAGAVAAGLALLAAVAGLGRLGTLDDPVTSPQDQLLPFAVILLLGLALLLGTLLALAAVRGVRAGYSTATM